MSTEFAIPKKDLDSLYDLSLIFIDDDLFLYIDKKFVNVHLKPFFMTGYGNGLAFFTAYRTPTTNFRFNDPHISRVISV